MHSTDLVVWGVVTHLVADWLLQNKWMSDNKTRLINSNAAWTHAIIHLLAALLVFPPAWAFVIAVTHVIIDTRRPLNWWRRVYRQTTTGEAAMHVAIWGDQVLHILIIALVALANG